MGKFLISASSFFIFIIGLYFLANISLFYAAGIGILLLTHELGHVLALINTGNSVKGVYFFPFVGAIVVGNKKPKTENEHAYIKYLGPFAGTFATFITLGIFLFTNDQKFLNLVFLGSTLNLINMIPITLLDGYGILRGSVKYIEWVGCLILTIFGFFIFKEYVLTLFFLTIFILFTDSPTRKVTGFKVYEAIMATVFILVMITLTIIQTDTLVSNIPLIILSLYLFGLYIKSTCFDKNGDQMCKEDGVELTQLTAKEKNLWITKYLILVITLLGLAFYSK